MRKYKKTIVSVFIIASLVCACFIFLKSKFSEKSPANFGTENVKSQRKILARFGMGKAGDKYSNSSHGVNLDRKFIMENHEVTQAEYKSVMGGLPSALLGQKINRGLGDNHPVYYVSWYDALSYCNRRSLSENLVPCYTIKASKNPDDWGTVPTYDDAVWNAAECDFDANGYRLPTEAEWEYMANDEDSLPLEKISWYDKTSEHTSHAVMEKAPNKNGMYDMFGNVWEWCWDWYEISASETGRTGGSGGSCRSIRGGGWFSSFDQCGAHSRSRYFPGFSDWNLGFRVVRTVSDICVETEVMPD